MSRILTRRALQPIFRASINCNGKLLGATQPVLISGPRTQHAGEIILGGVNGDSLAEVKPYSAMPGPRNWPFIGCVPAVYKAGGLTGFHHALRHFREQYGDIYKLNMLGMNLVALADPAIVEEVYRKEGKYPFREKSIPAWEDYHKDRNLSTGIFVMSGEEWWLHRKALNPKMMKPKQVELYAPAINEVSNDLVTAVMEARDSEGLVKLEQLLPKWSFESACRFIFERRFGVFDKVPNPKYIEFVHASQKAISAILDTVQEIPALSRRFGSKARKETYKNFDILYGTGTELIKEKLKEVKEKELENRLDDETLGEFIPYLYHVRKMSIKDIISDINSLFFAAVETTSTTTLWSLYYLSKNQDKQEKLREELVGVIGDDAAVSAKQLQKLPYVKGVVKEVLRCSGVVPINSRIFSEEVIINGYRAPKDTMFLLLHNVMANDPKYFDNPNQFLPERWARGSDNKLNPFVSLPFGFGPRMCLGRRLAEMEIHILLAKLIRQYKVECMQTNVNSKMTGLVKPDVPLQFRFTEV